MSACLKVTFPKWSEVVKIAVLKAAFTLSPMYFRPLSQHHWWKWEIGKSQEVRLGPSFIHVSENKPSYFQPSAIRGSCRPHKVKLTYHLQKPSQKHLLARALYTVCICIYIYISVFGRVQFGRETLPLGPSSPRFTKSHWASLSIHLMEGPAPISTSSKWFGSAPSGALVEIQTQKLSHCWTHLWQVWKTSKSDLHPSGVSIPWLSFRRVHNTWRLRS